MAPQKGWRTVLLEYGQVYGVLAVVLAGTYGVLDYANLRPVWKKEFQQQVMNETQTLQKLQDQQLQVVDQLLRLRYYTLVDKRAINGRLTQREQVELCDTAKQLGISLNATPGC